MNRTSFVVSIHHQENHSWQGTIQWLETGKTLHFRSQLEMLRLMDEATNMEMDQKEDLRSWASDSTIRAV